MRERICREALRKVIKVVGEKHGRAPIYLKVTGYTFRGSNSVIFIIASYINWGQLINERICSHRSKFFPLRVDPFMGRPRPPEKETGSHENFLLLKTWGEGKMDSFTSKTVYRVQPDQMINTCSCGYVITHPQEHILIISSGCTLYTVFKVNESIFPSPHACMKNGLREEIRWCGNLRLTPFPG